MKLKKLAIMACAGLAAMALMAGCGGSDSGKAASGDAAAKKTAEAAAPAPTSKTLVVYYSASGSTKAVAESIAKDTGADIFELVPKNQYTSDDLNYNDNNSRANREMNDASVRPELAGDKIDLDSYDAIYLGYPIWWGTAPRIVESFLDSYSCDGKTIYLFCTSGSSGAEKSLKDLQKLYPKINFAAADRFNAKASDTDVSNWLSRLSN